MWLAGAGQPWPQTCLPNSDNDNCSRASPCVQLLRKHSTSCAELTMPWETTAEEANEQNPKCWISSSSTKMVPVEVAAKTTTGLCYRMGVKGSLSHSLRSGGSKDQLVLNQEEGLQISCKNCKTKTWDARCFYWGLQKCCGSTSWNSEDESWSSEWHQWSNYPSLTLGINQEAVLIIQSNKLLSHLRSTDTTSLFYVTQHFCHSEKKNSHSQNNH